MTIGQTNLVGQLSLSPQNFGRGDGALRPSSPRDRHVRLRPARLLELGDGGAEAGEARMQPEAPVAHLARLVEQLGHLRAHHALEKGRVQPIFDAVDEEELSHDAL